MVFFLRCSGNWWPGRVGGYVGRWKAWWLYGGWGGLREEHHRFSTGCGVGRGGEGGQRALYGCESEDCYKFLLQVTTVASPERTRLDRHLLVVSRIFADWWPCDWTTALYCWRACTHPNPSPWSSQNSTKRHFRNARPQYQKVHKYNFLVNARITIWKRFINHWAK